MAKQKIEIQHKINILKVQKEKIEESNGLCDELAQFIYSIEDLLDFNKERNELLLRYEQERR